MKKILFVCLGNICRSTMAEFLCKKMIEDRNQTQNVLIESRGTSAMTGSRVYHGTARILDTLNIDYSQKRSMQLTKSDGNNFDYLIGMDKTNIRDMKRIVGENNAHKVHLLMSYTGLQRDIADPYYTGNFNETYNDVTQGLESFLDDIL